MFASSQSAQSISSDSIHFNICDRGKLYMPFGKNRFKKILKRRFFIVFLRRALEKRIMSIRDFWHTISQEWLHRFNWIFCRFLHTKVLHIKIISAPLVDSLLLWVSPRKPRTIAVEGAQSISSDRAQFHICDRGKCLMHFGESRFKKYWSLGFLFEFYENP